jgi:hypothetical protein
MDESFIGDGWMVLWEAIKTEQGEPDRDATNDDISIQNHRMHEAILDYLNSEEE